MGILDGKRILVAGVTMDSSIGFATAKVAQEQGATVLISNFGRALGITRRIAKRLPDEPPVLELDVTDDAHLGAAARRWSREHVDGLDGVVHSIAFGNPETLLGGKFLAGALGRRRPGGAGLGVLPEVAGRRPACPLMAPGGSVVGLTFDATVAWPAYDWMGVAKAGLESTSRYLARDLGPEGRPGQPGQRRAAEDPGRQGDPRLRASWSLWATRVAAGLGQHRPGADRPAVVRAAVATSSPPRPARSCTSTAASTRWAPERADARGAHDSVA